MPRKKLRDWPVICRQYWVKPVEKELPKEAVDELYKMNKFWNELVAIWEQSREKYNTALGNDSEVAPVKAEYDVITERANACFDELKKARIKYHIKKGVQLDPFVKDLKQLQSEKKEIFIKLKEAKAKAKASTKKDELKALTSKFFDDIKEAGKRAYRKENKFLYWGNANAVSNSFMSAWRRGLKTGNSPKFHRFTGEGRFVFQFVAGGMKTEALFGGKGGNSKIKISPFNRAVYHDDSLSQRQRKKLTKARLTVNLGGIDIPFHIQIHRDIPDGYVKNAILTRKKTGTNINWDLSLTIEIPQKDMPTPKRQEKLAAIDMGYRVIDGRLRIGMLVADDRRENLWLPDKVIQSLKHANEIQSKKDNLLEKIKKDIIDKLPLSEMPAGLKTNWGKARQPRLYKILAWAKENEHFLKKDLERFLEQDRRLFNECTGLKARALRHRKWAYSNLGHRLCREFSVLIIEKLNLAEMAKKEGKDGVANELVAQARENRNIAAIGHFFTALKNSAEKEHSEIKETQAAYTTTTCHVCGEIVKTKDKSKLIWECNACGAEWDQDYNAAVNLFKTAQSGGKMLCEPNPHADAL